MSGPAVLKTDKIDVKAFLKVICFLVYAIFITCIFRFVSTFVACYILVLTVLSCFLYGFLSKSNQRNNPGLSLFEHSNVAKLLRYATAVLSFVSLLTTANGLQGFVFSNSEAWLAYLASFAVQAILVSFSLTYCYIFNAIGEITTFSPRGKVLMQGTLTVFLAMSFMISSSFSFSYIANNAYKKSWVSDSETMIERYLSQGISDLDTENTRIGDLVYNQIQHYNEMLDETVGDYIISYNTTLVSTLDAFKFDDFNLVEDSSEHGYGLTNAIVENWEKLYPRYAPDISGVVGQFDDSVKTLRSYDEEYNQIVRTFNFKETALANKWDLVDSGIEDIYKKLNSLYKKLESLQKSCDGLYVYIIDEDILPYKTSLIRAVDDFKNFVDEQIQRISDLKTAVNVTANDYLSADGKDSLPSLIKTLQKKIYMLNDVYISDGTDALSDDVRSILEGLSNIVVTYQDEDILSADVVANISKLETLVKEYQSYLELIKQIEQYTDENLAITYNIVDMAEGTDTVNSGSVINVTYEQWLSLRDQDFLQFFALLKRLPVDPGQETQFHKQEETQSDESKYTTANVLYEANVFRRDLLGKITDFERAFNFFKYDFKIMALFSICIAVFFDLGAFLTGCFLYGIKQFERTSAPSNCSKSKK